MTNFCEQNVIRFRHLFQLSRHTSEHCLKKHKHHRSSKKTFHILEVAGISGLKKSSSCLLFVIENV